MDAEIVWEFKPDNKALWNKQFRHILVEVLIMGLIIYLMKIFNTKFDVAFIDTILVYLILPFYIIYKYNWDLYIATTMQYHITKEAIHYTWWEWGQKRLSIPLSEITALDLVGSKTNALETLFISTANSYELPRMNFENSDKRHHATLERLDKGQEVKDLIKSVKP